MNPTPLMVSSSGMLVRLIVLSKVATNRGSPASAKPRGGKDVGKVTVVEGRGIVEGCNWELKWKTWDKIRDFK